MTTANAANRAVRRSARLGAAAAARVASNIPCAVTVPPATVVIDDRELPADTAVHSYSRRAVRDALLLSLAAYVDGGDRLLQQYPRPTHGTLLHRIIPQLVQQGSINADTLLAILRTSCMRLGQHLVENHICE